MCWEGGRSRVQHVLARYLDSSFPGKLPERQSCALASLKFGALVSYVANLMDWLKDGQEHFAEGTF